MVDERSLEALRRLRKIDSGPRLTVAQFKKTVREQFFMLLLDPEAALAAIPKLLPESAEERRAGFAAIQEVLSASAAVSGEVAARLKRVSELFGGDSKGASGKRSGVPVDPKAKAKAS
jgi:hypothetical protein